MKFKIFSKKSILLFPVVFAIFSGCSRNSGTPVEQLEKASADMSRQEAPQTGNAGSPTAPALPSVSQEMKSAMDDYKAGKLTEAVTRFQQMRSHPAITGEQLMSLNQAAGVVMGDLYTRAANGDEKAKQAVAAYQSFHHGH